MENRLVSFGCASCSPGAGGCKCAAVGVTGSEAVLPMLVLLGRRPWAVEAAHEMCDDSGFVCGLC